MRTRLGIVAVLAIAVVVAAVLVLGHADPARADLVCKPDASPRATLLLFHPGGYVSGDSRGLQAECRAFAQRGFLAVSVEYSKRYFKAIGEANARAAKYRPSATHRPLFAYGLSSGGTFAALLAERGEVDAAFSFAGVYDVANWAGPNKSLMKAMGVSRANLAHKTPIDALLEHPAPLLIMHNRNDAIAPYRAAKKLAGRSPRFRLKTVLHPTNGYAAHIAHPIAPAMTYFERFLSAEP